MPYVLYLPSSCSPLTLSPLLFPPILSLSFFLIEYYSSFLFLLLLLASLFLPFFSPVSNPPFCSFLLGYVHTKVGKTDVILLGWFIAAALVVRTYTSRQKMSVCDVWGAVTWGSQTRCWTCCLECVW